MPITELDYLLLRDEAQVRTWMMLKSDRQFHLVRVDGTLTEQKYKRLMKRYPCGLNTFRELGIAVKPLNREKCTYAIFEGTREGDRLTLWFSGEMRYFTLGDTYEKERLEAFFDTQQHRWDQPEKPAGPDGKLTRIIGWSLNGLTFGLLLAALAGRFFPLLSLLVFAVTVALCICWPGRFLSEEQSGNADRRVIRVGMELSLIAPPMIMALYETEYAVYRQWPLLLAGGAVLGLLIGGAILWRSRAYRTGGIWLLIGLMMVSGGTLAQINQLLDFDPTASYTQTVDRTEESKHFRGGTSYYCYVTMPDGEQEQFSISAHQFEQLQPGDAVAVVVHDGALGLEYMTIELEE